MANRYWVGGTGTWDTTTTTNWSATSGGTGGASVPTATDSVFFDQATNYTVTMTGALLCLDLTVSAGTPRFATGTTPTLTISGSMSIIAGTTWNSTGTITFNATTAKTITTNGQSFNCPFTFGGTGGTWQLLDALTTSSTRLTAFNSGTLDLNGKTLTTGSFSSSTTSTRVIAFGAGNITVTGTGTVWTTATITALTVTGTPVVNVVNNTATAATVASGTMSEGNSISFNFTTGTYALTFLGTASYTARNVDFTGFAGTWSATSTGIIFGNLTLSTGMTLTTSASAMTFGATSGTKTLTTNGKTIIFPVTFNGVGGTWQLLDALTLSTTQTATLTAGTLDLNGKTLTTGLFNSSGSSTRTLAFGTGNITVNGTGTIWTTATVTGLTVTGTPVVNVSNNSATAATVASGGLSEANAISFNFTTGTYSLSFLSTGGYTAKNIDFTGFAGTWAITSTGTIYGNLTLSASMSTTTSVNIMTFAGTSGTKTITSNGQILDFPITFNGVGATWQLQDAFTTTSSRTTTLTNGTLDLNGKTLTTGLFNSNNANIRTIAFGTGNITVTGSGTSWTINTITNLTITGTPVVNISNNSTSAVALEFGTLPEATAISYNINAGNYTLTPATGSAKHLDFTGFSGIWNANINAGYTIYGNLTMSPKMTTTFGTTNAMTFTGTSITNRTITSAGVDFNGVVVTINGAGCTWTLQDSWKAASTGTPFTLTNGTLDLNGTRLTVDVFQTGVGTKNITFNGGTIYCTKNTGTFWDNVNPTGFTTTEGTVTGGKILTVNNVNARTFNGGGSVYNCTLISGGTAAMTITGSNTFQNLGTTGVATPYTFTAGTTTTFTNLNVIGVSGALVTFQSSTTSSYTLSQTSGAVDCNYLSISRSTATGGATWFAGYNSTDGGNNTGWTFISKPTPLQFFGFIMP